MNKFKSICNKIIDFLIFGSIFQYLVHIISGVLLFHFYNWPIISRIDKLLPVTTNPYVPDIIVFFIGIIIFLPLSKIKIRSALFVLLTGLIAGKIFYKAYYSTKGMVESISYSYSTFDQCFLELLFFILGSMIGFASYKNDKVISVTKIIFGIIFLIQIVFIVRNGERIF